MFKLSLLFSIFSLFHISHGETVTWVIQESLLPYAPLTIYAGDTITFEYPGDNINVYLHPSGTCNDNDSEVIGSEGAGNATYTFKDSQIDTVVTFACQYWNYCEMFGMIINVLVLEPPPSSSPTSAPSKTLVLEPPPSSSPTSAPIKTLVLEPPPSSSPTSASSKPPSVPSKTNTELPIQESTVFPLTRCQGDCESDSDCDGYLICFQRDEQVAIPGCVGGESDVSRTDYCVRPTDLVLEPPTLSSTTENAEDDSEPSVWLWIFIGFVSLCLVVSVVAFVMWKCGTCRDMEATQATQNPPTAEPIARADAVLVEEGDVAAHPLPSAPPKSLVL